MKTQPFTQVPLSVLTDPELSATAKILYAFILARMNRAGYCWASTETLSGELNCTPRKITKDLAELQTREYIKRFFDKKGRKIYPQITVKGGEQMLQSPMNSRSGNNSPSKEGQENNNHHHQNGGAYYSTQDPLERNPLKQDALFRATEGEWDIPTFTSYISDKYGSNYRETEEYKAIIKKMKVS